jgi:hypothetical protein
MPPWRAGTILAPASSVGILTSKNTQGPHFHRSTIVAANRCWVRPIPKSRGSQVAGLAFGALQLGITNAEHLRAGVIPFTFAFHTSLRKSMFSIVVETKRSSIHCKSNQAAERNMIARRLCWGRPEVGQCPVRSTYLVFPTPQRNSSIKLDVDAAG